MDRLGGSRGQPRARNESIMPCQAAHIEARIAPSVRGAIAVRLRLELEPARLAARVDVPTSQPHAKQRAVPAAGESRSDATIEGIGAKSAALPFT